MRASLHLDGMAWLSRRTTVRYCSSARKRFKLSAYPAVDPAPQSAVTPILNPAVNSPRGGTRRRPCPLRSTLAGAVIGSKQTNSAPDGEKIWAALYPVTDVTVMRRPPPAT